MIFFHQHSNQRAHEVDAASILQSFNYLKARDDSVMYNTVDNNFNCIVKRSAGLHAQYYSTVEGVQCRTADRCIMRYSAVCTTVKCCYARVTFLAQLNCFCVSVNVIETAAVTKSTLYLTVPSRTSGQFSLEFNA